MLPTCCSYCWVSWFFQRFENHPSCWLYLSNTKQAISTQNLQCHRLLTTKETHSLQSQKIVSDVKDQIKLQLRTKLRISKDQIKLQLRTKLRIPKDQTTTQTSLWYKIVKHNSLWKTLTRKEITRHLIEHCYS